MRVVRNDKDLGLKKQTIATIGTFDGVHIGHQHIIESVTKEAKRTNLPSLLITFDNHPRKVLARGENVETLMSLDEKLTYLARFDLDFVYVLGFKQIAELSAQEFCKIYLIERSKVSHLFIGSNFRFGAGATGDVSWLNQNCRDSFNITEIPLEVVGETVVSSTRIRDLVRLGKVDEIPPLLGRNITLPGRVVRGAGRGAGLGFPTANLEFDPGICAPGAGIYIGYLWAEDLQLEAIINCGFSPTFGENTFQCEAHCLDYNAELYGSIIKLELAKRIRDEKKFPSPEALSRQITHDVHTARTWFRGQRKE